MAALLGTQLNFIRAPHYQAKDKIRLLTQKLEEKNCCSLANLEVSYEIFLIKVGSRKP